MALNASTGIANRMLVRHSPWNGSVLAPYDVLVTITRPRIPEPSAFL